VLLTKSEKAESNEAKRKEGRRCEDESESAQRRGKTLRVAKQGARGRQTRERSICTKREEKE